MNAEFNWWLLIVGLVIGAALTWLVMADLVRRDADVDAAEQAGEARWIATILTDTGRPIAADRVDEVLRLHRDYLAAPPPDDPMSVPDDDGAGNRAPLGAAAPTSPPPTVGPAQAQPAAAPARTSTTAPGEPGG